MRTDERVVACALAAVLATGVVTVARGSGPDALSATGTSAAAGAPAGALQAVDRPLDPAPLSAQRADRQRVAPAVAPLRTLRRADLLVTLRAPLSAQQAAQLRAVKGVQGLTVLDIGTVRQAGRSVRIAGVDPSQFRQFTPAPTAASDALWQSVARGEVVVSHAVQRSRRLTLGATTAFVGHHVSRERIGGAATFGLPEVEVVTDRATTRALGVVRDSAVLLDAPERAIGPLRRAVAQVVGEQAALQVLRPAPLPRNTRRPATYRELYVQSARLCPGLPWQVLAAVGEVESGHGRSLGPSSAGALGPMQFMPATWRAYGVDGDGDGRADVMSAYDAVPAAALYLCRNGAGGGPEGLYNALFAYNRADWYVRKVLAAAERYA